ncbi:hypothetical protein IWQ51_002027 [Labrenzia sp. EL_142]|nr:hypothetical protein [Labrenzia sp. EL_142]
MSDRVPSRSTPLLRLPAKVAINTVCMQVSSQQVVIVRKEWKENKTRFVDTRKALGALNRKIGVDFRAKGGKKLFQQMRL